MRIVVPRVAHGEWHGPRDDDHVIRPARSIRIHGLGSASEATLTPRAWPALHRLFKREQFDLLHIHAPCDIGLPSWALWAFSGPIVGTIHSYFSPGPVRRGTRSPGMPTFRARSEAAMDYADALQRALVPATEASVTEAHAMARLYDWSRIVPRSIRYSSASM